MPIAEINGTMLHYDTKGSGLPIIFVHPPLLESNNFMYQKVQLSDKYQIITFDIRGHGLSLYSKRPITYQLLAQDIIQLLEYLKIKKAFICGYSTGGSIALETILTFPDLFYGGILISGMSEVSDPTLKRTFRLSLYATSLHAKRLMTAGIAWGNADSPRTFKRLFRASMRGDIRSYKQYYKFGMTYNCTNRLKEIKAPMLLLYGEKDTGFFKYAKILKDQLPDSTLYFIKNAKHQLPTKWARSMNAQVRQWIESQQLLNKTSAPQMIQDIPFHAFEPTPSHEQQFHQE
jgi:pimeloyl-ACP methyl ester carboxylesterase